MSNLYSTAIRDIDGNEISNVGPPNIGRVAGTLDASLNYTVVNGQISSTPNATPYIINIVTGLPVGGMAGQQLIKNTNDNFDVTWGEPIVNYSGGIPFWSTPQQWVNSGCYGFLEPKVHYVSTTGLLLTEVVGATLYGFGAGRQQNKSNYGRGMTVIAASGIYNGTALITSYREQLNIQNIAFHGTPTINSGNPVPVLFHLTDPGGGSANAGTSSFRHVTFERSSDTGLRIGTSDGGTHNEHILLEQCDFNSTPIGVQIYNDQAMGMMFNLCTFSDCVTGIKINAGGNITLNNPVMLSPNSTLIASTGQGSNNATIICNNFKFDDQAGNHSRLIDCSGGTTNQALMFLVNCGQVADDTYANGNQIDGNSWFTRIYGGMTCVMNGVYNLQSGMLAWLDSSAYGDANYILNGCHINISQTGVQHLLNSGGPSTGSVTLRTYGCVGVNGTVLTDQVIRIVK